MEDTIIPNRGVLKKKSIREILVGWHFFEKYHNFRYRKSCYLKTFCAEQ